MAKHVKGAHGAKDANDAAAARTGGYGWLDDAFDDEKQAAELERAQTARNIGCLVGALVILAMLILLAVVGCGMLASLSL